MPSSSWLTIRIRANKGSHLLMRFQYAGFEDDTRIYLVMEYAAGVSTCECIISECGPARGQAWTAGLFMLQQITQQLAYTATCLYACRETFLTKSSAGEAGSQRQRWCRR